MASNQYCLYLTLLFLLVGLTSSSSSFISNDVFESHASNGRSLLQAKKSCPENMENKNYTIITSQCKGPHFPAKACCEALKEFACPFADAINDLSTDCSTTMFSYINLYGKYPPGLFANQCKEGKEGLDCEKVLEKLKAEKSSAQISSTESTMLIFTSAFLVLLFCLF